MKNTHPSIYLIAGGIRGARKGPDPLLVSALAQAGHARPSIAYIGAASDDNPDFFNWMTNSLKQAGAGKVTMAPLVSPRADLVKTREIIADSDMVFLSGGDVEAGMQHLEERGIIPFLEKLFLAGQPFFGMSAGSIMLSRNWVRWVDPEDDSTCEVFPCLGFTPVLCDMHAESDDWVELKMLLKLGPRGIGYGIPAGAALRVEAKGVVTALGKPVQQFKLQKKKIVRLEPLEPQ